MKLPVSHLLLAATFAAVPVIHATTPYANRLTGDWGGERTRQAERGAEVFAYYNGIVAANVSGGLYTDEGYAGDTFAGVHLDLEALTSWEGVTFTLSGINRHGSSIDEAVGGQYSVMQLVGGQTSFLYNVTLEKQFREGAYALKIGRMTATDDFVGSPLYSYSLNNAVNGQIRAVLFDGVMTSYPFAVWGGRFAAQTSANTRLMIGVFQLSDEMFEPHHHGLDFTIRSDDGVSVFTQFDWTPEFAGRPARFYVGVNQAFHTRAEYSGGESSRFTRFYAHADYQVYRASAHRDEGLTLFATLAYTNDDEVAILPLQSSIGAHYKGLLPGRPDDRAVFFVTYGGFSDAYSRQRVAEGLTEVDHEMVFEAGYRVQLPRGSYLQPDLQYIKRPGGTGNISDAWVLGMQFGTSF